MATKKIQIIPPGYTDVCYPQTIASAVIEEADMKFMTAAEKTKLSGIATGANNYTHPSTHPPSIIAQDASNRFVTDTEKATWNAKETTAGSQAKVDAHIAVKTNPHAVTKAQVGLGSVSDYGIATQAEAEAGTLDTKYMTPLKTKQAITKAAPVNATTSVSGLMSSTDKAKLDGVATGANNYIHPTTDGNKHVPATGTTDNGKVLKAGATAGSLSWGTLTATDVGAYTKTEIDNKEFIYSDPAATFESFDPINAQFLGGNAPEYYARQSDLNDRGYLSSKNMNASHVDTLTSNGKYMNITGMPCTGTWVVDVISYNSTYVTQYASCIYDSEGKGYTGLKFTRDYLGGVWGSWLRYANSDHVMWNYNATGGAKNNVDFNSLTIHGEHQIALGSTNGPTTENYWDVFVFGGGEPTQIAKNIITGKLYNRVYKSPAWQPWTEIVQESYYIMTNSDLRNNWVLYSQVSVTRQGNLVTIEGVIQSGTRTDGILAMVLPIEFRPTGIRHTFSLCTPGSGSSKCIGTQIGTDGAVVLVYGASDQYVLLNLTFRI